MEDRYTKDDIARLLKTLLNTPIYRTQLDSNERLKIVVDTAIPALPASTARIGYVPITQRLMALPFTDSTANLGANATFTGTGRDTQIDATAPFAAHGIFQVFTSADQIGTLFIQESTDNVTYTTATSIATTSITDIDASTKFVVDTRWNVTLRFVRLVYKNGATPTTTLRISSRVTGA